MNNKKTSENLERYSILRKNPTQPHPKQKPKTSQSKANLPDKKLAEDELKTEAFEAIWNLLDSKESRNILTDLNTGVFEQIKEFCEKANKQKADQIPIGALFTGSLIPCNQVEPLHLLVEVLRAASFPVAVLHPDHTITAILEQCNQQFAGFSTNFPLTLDSTRHPKSPIVVVESMESFDCVLFSDLLSLLVRNLESLPVILLVGLSTTTRVDPFIPVNFRSRLSSRPFSLMSPRQCFERVLERTLLSPQCPGIVCGRRVFEIFNNQYLYHHFTVSSFKTTLQFALLDHISTNPPAFLAQFMTAKYSKKSELSKALKRLPSSVWSKEGMLSGVENSEISEVLLSSLERVAGWKVCLLCTHLIAETTGWIKRGAGYTLRELYISSLDFQFPRSIPKVSVWYGEAEGVETKLDDLLGRLRSVMQAFSACCPLIGQTETQIEGFRQRLNDALILGQTAESITVELDAVMGRLVEEYCLVSLESLPGAGIFCLSNTDLVKKRLFPAPRLEIPKLLTDDEKLKKVSDTGDLLKDSALLYNLYLETISNGNNVFDCFVEFARHYDVLLPETPENIDLENGKKTENRSSSEGLRIRFECAVRALEELGLVKRMTRGDDQTVRIEVFND